MTYLDPYTRDGRTRLMLRYLHDRPGELSALTALSESPKDWPVPMYGLWTHLLDPGLLQQRLTELGG